MKLPSLLIIVNAALSLSSCVAGPNYKDPTIELPAKFSEASAKKAPNKTLDPWWQAFRDPRLTALVQQGMNENLGVLASLERVVQAQSEVTVAGAGAEPQINTRAAATISGQRGSYLRGATDRTNIARTAQSGTSASWLLDFFGQYRRMKEEAQASLDAAYDDVNVARLAYFSDLTATYVDIRYFQAAIAETRINLASRRQTFSLITEIKEAGSASRLDVSQSEGLVNEALAQLPGLDAELHRAANHMATLLGQPAATMTAELLNGAGQPMPSYSSKAGVPAELLRNRPDIRRAERLLAAATAHIGVAEAQLYPSLSLSGNINTAQIASHSATGGLLSWSFGPSLNLPIFNGGSLKAEVKIARSAANSQYIAWKQTVLQAAEEVENAQIALRRDYETVAATKRLVTSYQQSVSLARESYKAGESTALDVLDAERNVADARLSLALVKRDLSRDYIALNVATGCGSDIGMDAPNM